MQWCAVKSFKMISDNMKRTKSVTASSIPMDSAQLQLVVLTSSLMDKIKATLLEYSDPSTFNNNTNSPLESSNQGATRMNININSNKLSRSSIKVSAVTAGSHSNDGQQRKVTPTSSKMSVRATFSSKGKQCSVLLHHFVFTKLDCSKLTQQHLQKLFAFNNQCSSRASRNSNN